MPNKNIGKKFTIEHNLAWKHFEGEGVSAPISGTSLTPLVEAWREYKEHLISARRLFLNDSMLTEDRKYLTKITFVSFMNWLEERER